MMGKQQKSTGRRDERKEQARPYLTKLKGAEQDPPAPDVPDIEDEYSYQLGKTKAVTINLWKGSAYIHIHDQRKVN